jgi:LAO/AO transport system kinase
VWAAVEKHQHALEERGDLAAKRARQQVDWMWAMVRDQLMDRLQSDPTVREALPRLEADVRAGDLTPTLAAQRILRALGLPES